MRGVDVRDPPGSLHVGGTCPEDRTQSSGQDLHGAGPTPCVSHCPPESLPSLPRSLPRGSLAPRTPLLCFTPGAAFTVGLPEPTLCCLPPRAQAPGGSIAHEQQLQRGAPGLGRSPQGPGSWLLPPLCLCSH